MDMFHACGFAYRLYHRIHLKIHVISQYAYINKTISVAMPVHACACVMLHYFTILPIL